MKTKHKVCLFIKDEEHLEEMREFLESKGEKISIDGDFKLDKTYLLNYLKISLLDKNWYLSGIGGRTQVTTEQFKKLWE